MGRRGRSLHTDRPCAAPSKAGPSPRTQPVTTTRPPRFRIPLGSRKARHVPRRRRHARSRRESRRLNAELALRLDAVAETLSDDFEARRATRPERHFAGMRAPGARLERSGPDRLVRAGCSQRDGGADRGRGRARDPAGGAPGLYSLARRQRDSRGRRMDTAIARRLMGRALERVEASRCGGADGASRDRPPAARAQLDLLPTVAGQLCPAARARPGIRDFPAPLGRRARRISATCCGSMRAALGRHVGDSRESGVAWAAAELDASCDPSEAWAAGVRSGRSTPRPRPPASRRAEWLERSLLPPRRSRRHHAHAGSRVAVASAGRACHPRRSDANRRLARAVALRLGRGRRRPSSGARRAPAGSGRRASGRCAR